MTIVGKRLGYKKLLLTEEMGLFDHRISPLWIPIEKTKIKPTKVTWELIGFYRSNEEVV